MHPPRHLALLANPTSGRGRGGRLVGPVAERLRAGGARVDVLVGADADAAYDLARAAVAAGVDALVALGGDGMVNLATQVVAGTGTPLGVVPAGTGNDIARLLGLPRGPRLADALAAADVVRAGRVTSLDAGRVAGRWFLSVLSSGFDSTVNERANRMRWPGGRWRYDVAIAAELRTFRPLPYVLELDGETWRTEAMLVAVGNGRSYGGGMLVCPDADPTDGRFDVVVVGPLSRPEFLRVFPSVFRGEHVSHPAVSVRRAATVTLAAPGMTAYADGERVSALPVTAETVPAAVQVLVPWPAGPGATVGAARPDSSFLTRGDAGS